MSQNEKTMAEIEAELAELKRAPFLQKSVIAEKVIFKTAGLLRCVVAELEAVKQSIRG